MQNKIENIASLNIIRAITSLIIVVYHAKFILWCGGSAFLNNIGLKSWLDYPLFALDMLSSNGEPIVVCFFILSGFVITHSYRKTNYSNFKFYLIRFSRIYIPFLNSILISILAIVFAFYVNPKLFNLNIREYNTRLVYAWNNLNMNSFFQSFFLTKDKEYIGLNFVYWSLLHEVVFYFIYPIYNVIKSKGRILLFMLMTILFLITKNSLIYYQIYFLIGIFIYDFFTLQKQNKTIVNSKFLNLLLIGIFYLLMTISFIKEWKITADIFSTLMSLFAFDYLLTHIKKPNKYLSQLSDFSYTLYLNHLAVLLILYAVFSKLLNKEIFFERQYYYLGVILSVYICKHLFYAEKLSLILIQKLKNTFSTSQNIKE